MPLIRSHSSRRIAGLLYESVVAAARAPFFYRDLLVPDTIEGRYEMIVLHATLLLRRLRDPAVGRRRLAQAVVDYMAADFDRSIRELGVGDLSVARFMQRLGEGLYGRAAAYDAALDNGDSGALMTAIQRNIFSGIDPGGRILALIAGYVERQRDHLQTQLAGDLALGQVNFIEPEDRLSS